MRLFASLSRQCVICLLFNCSIFAQWANAEESEDNLKDTLRILNPLNYWRVTPGAGLHFTSISLTRKSDGFVAELDDGDSGDQYLSFDVESPAWMLNEQYGFSFRGQTQTFNISKQKVPRSDPDMANKSVDLGTSVKGVLSYAGPTFFVKFEGNPLTRMERGGAGIVYWDAYFSGDAIFTKDLQATKDMPKTPVDGEISGGLGFIYYLQWFGDRWMLELAGSVIETSNADYRMRLESTSLVFGYSF